MHPGAVCLATIPLAQNPSPLQRRKHRFACPLTQKPFDGEFSPPRGAQLLPMIPPLPLNHSRTLPYPLLFLPYPTDVFLPPPHPSRPPDAPCVFSSIRRTFSYSSFFLPLPSTRFTSAKRYTVGRTIYSPPGIFPCSLSHCLTDLLVFIHPTHYYDFLAYDRPPATRPLHYWYHNLVSSELVISIIYFAFICIHDYRLLIKRFPLSSRSGGFFGVAWRVRRFSRQRHTGINYSPPLVCDTASRFESTQPRSHPKLPPQCLLII